MAKYKAARPKKSTTPASSNKGLIPCAIIILLGFGLIFVLFYFSLSSN